jgi:hypothetical protein
VYFCLKFQDCNDTHEFSIHPVLYLLAKCNWRSVHRQRMDNVFQWEDRILREKDRGTGLALMRAKKSFDLLGFQSSLKFIHRQIWVWLVKDVKLLLPVALCFGFIQNCVLCFDLSLQLVDHLLAIYCWLLSVFISLLLSFASGLKH